MAGCDGMRALVALGANLSFKGSAPAATVARAMDALGDMGLVEGRSRLWRSPAWPPGGPDYVNAALALRVMGPPEAVLAALHAVEAAFGRARDARWGPRTLDLDLLSLDGPDGPLVRPDAATQDAWRALDPASQAREAPSTLVLPHPRMQDRAFVLLPLREVAPDWRHPLLGLDAGGMLRALPPGAADGVEPLAGSAGGLAGGAPLANAAPTH